MGTDDKKIRNFESIQHFLFPDKDHKKLLKTNKAWFVSQTLFQSQMGHMMWNLVWTVREKNIFISND